ncbi:PilZ domain-containing protein [Desulfoplanes sp.]
MTASEKDRRKFKRLSKQYKMELSEFTFPLTDMVPFEVTGVDISEGGLAVRCSDHFQTGQKVQVKICIPRLNKYHPGFFKVFENDLGQYITAVAEIVWSRHGEGGEAVMLGLEFVDVYEDDLKALNNLIRDGLE